MSVIWSKSGGLVIVTAIKIPYPSYTGIILYTGSAIQPAWTNYDENKITIGGTVTAINAGTYTTSFTPKEGFCWENGSTTAYSVKWTIYKEKLAVPSQSGTLTYNGSSQTPSWKNYNSTKLTIGGTTTSANAGTFEAVFNLKNGYIWSDGTTATKKVKWTIQKLTPVVTASTDAITLSLSADREGKTVIWTTTANKIQMLSWGNITIINCSDTSEGGTNTQTVLIKPLAVGSAYCTCGNYDDNNLVAAEKTVDITVTA